MRWAVKGVLAAFGILTVGVLSLGADGADASARIDTGFGVDGVAAQTVPESHQAVAAVEMRSGKLVAFGYHPDGSLSCGDVYSARFGEDGSVDSAYGLGGYSFASLQCQVPSAAAFQRDGRIAVGTSIPGNSCSLGAAIGPAGGLVPWASGDDREYVRLCVGPQRGQRGNVIHDVAVDKSGRTLFAGGAQWGASRTVGYAYRFKSNGLRDASFKGRGATRGPAAGQVRFFPRRSGKNFSGIDSVKPLNGGRILVSGHYANQSMVARLKEDGSLDRTFGKNGFFRRDFDGAPHCDCSKIYAVTRDRHGRVLAAAETFRLRSAGLPKDIRSVVLRLTSKGELDRKFGKGGIARVSSPGLDWDGTTMALQADGRILLAGAFVNPVEDTSALAVVRLLSDGRVDKSFFGGTFTGDTVYAGSKATDMFIDHAGRIVIAGGTKLDTPGQPALLRVLPN